jgi:AcrR family transcriptional regulator
MSSPDPIPLTSGYRWYVIVLMATRLRRAELVERNREVVLESARRVFLDQGYAGATVETIADEAGFSKGVVYSQFGSKADLFLALLERRIEERSKKNERIAGERAGTEGLREILLIASRNATLEQGWTQVLVEFRAIAGRDPALRRRYAQAHALTVEKLASVLVQLHDQAGLQPRLPFRAMAEFVLAVDSGITLERSANPAALSEEDLSAMVPRALGFLDTS